MRRLIGFVITGIVGASSLGWAAPAIAATRVTTASGMTVIDVPLSGAAAVPPGDPDGTGVADLVIGPDRRVCFRLIVSKIGPITGVHIHEAVAGKQGPHAIDLFGPDVVVLTDGSQVFRGCVDGGAKVAEVLVAPARFYVNVHTHEFPLGALRGQLG